MLIDGSFYRGRHVPGGIPRINRQHPLAYGLVEAFVSDGVSPPQDLLRGLSLNQGTNGGSGTNIGGSGFKFNGSSQIAYANSSLVNGVDSFSIFSFFTPVALAASAAFFGYTNSASTANTAQIKTDATTSSKVRLAVADSLANSGSISEPTGSMVAGTPIAVGGNVSFNNTGVSKLYVNGQFRASGTTVAGSIVSNVTGMGASRINTITGFANCLVHCTFTWNRQLTDAEQLTLGLHPTCLLIYPEDEIASMMTGFITGALTAGTANTLSVGSTIATVVVSNASGGTAPYTYQWYRSTTSGFTPGPGTLIPGATNHTLNDTGLTNGTAYYYKNVVTDSASATAISTQTSATPVALTSGIASTVSVGSTVASLSVANATGGTPPYSYQWYRSNTSGFTPGPGNILLGATGQNLNDTGLTNGLTYFYINVVTDNLGSVSPSNQTAASPNTQIVKLSQLAFGGGYNRFTDLAVAVRQNADSTFTDVGVALPAPGGLYNIMDYEAACDGVRLTNITTSGSPTVASSLTYTFTSANIGQLFTYASAAAPTTKLFCGTIVGVSGGNAILSGTGSGNVTGTGIAFFGTDDLPAWNSAINASNLFGGGTLVIPGAMSCISGPIQIGKFSSIIGYGYNKGCIKWISPNTMAVVGNEAAITGVNTALQPYTNNLFADFEIDMAAAFITGSVNFRAKCIDIVKMVNPTFRGLYLHDSPCTALGVDYIGRCQMIGNTIIGAGRLVTTRTSDGNAIAVECDNPPSSTVGESLICAHNIIVDPKIHGICIETFQDPGTVKTRAVITGNLILSTTVDTFDGINDDGWTGATITDNVIIKTVASTDGSGIAINGGVIPNYTGHRGIVANNYIEGWWNGIELKNVVGAFTNVSPDQYSVRGNTIFSSKNNGIAIYEESGNVCDTLNLSDNYINGAGAAGIMAGFLTGGSGGTIKNLTLSNNKISNCGVTTVVDAQKSGILFNTTILGLQLSDNYCFDNSTGTQKYGMTVNTGVSITNAFADSNKVDENATSGFNILGTISGTLTNNPGFNPQGPATLTPGASPWTYTAGNTPEVLYLYGGTISTVVKNSITLATATGIAVYLAANEPVTITYSSLPTAVRDRR